MNEIGYCSACSKYAQVLGQQPDGATIYRCYECGHMWGERLVVFDVSFALAERKADASLSKAAETMPVPVRCGDGLDSPTDGRVSA